MTIHKIKKGASPYRVNATFLDKWLQYFPTEDSPLSEQRTQSEQQKFWFGCLASSLSLRISNDCGPEASIQKKQWKEICKLQKEYEGEQNLKKAGNLLIKINEQVEQLRDSFVHLHNRLYGLELSKGVKALVLRAKHNDWSGERIAKEAGFAHAQSLYQIDGYRELVEMQKAFAERNSNIPHGSKDGETGDMEAWRQEDGVEKKQTPLAE